MGNQNVCGPAISNQVEVHLADQHNVPVIPLRCMNATGWKCEQKLCISCQSSWFLWAFEENKNYTCLSGVESIWFEENDIISQQTGKILTYNCWKNLGRILYPDPKEKGYVMQVNLLSSFFVVVVEPWAEHIQVYGDHMWLDFKALILHQVINRLLHSRWSPDQIFIQFHEEKNNSRVCTCL